MDGEVVSVNLVQWLFLVWYWMIESWIDIPNLQTVNLPGSFRYVQSKSITSICMNMYEWIDISPILTGILPFLLNDIESIDLNATSIHIPDCSVNIENYTVFNFSRFNLLEELIIGDYSFTFVSTFVIDGLNHLISLKIGPFSFARGTYDYNHTHSFHLLNCAELESVEIGEYGFEGYGGEFELRNLPKLYSISIGYIGNRLGVGSYNFRYSSFVVKGII